MTYRNHDSDDTLLDLLLLAIIAGCGLALRFLWLWWGEPR
jgi:hypothetical protein